MYEQGEKTSKHTQPWGTPYSASTIKAPKPYAEMWDVVGKWKVGQPAAAAELVTHLVRVVLITELFIRWRATRAHHSLPVHVAATHHLWLSPSLHVYTARTKRTLGCTLHL